MIERADDSSDTTNHMRDRIIAVTVSAVLTSPPHFTLEQIGTNE